MNGKNYFIPSRTIQRFVTRHGIKLIHNIARRCSCAHLPSCNFCQGTGIYYESGQVFHGIIESGKHSFRGIEKAISEKFEGQYTLLTTLRNANFDKMDLIIPTQGRWEVHNEVVRVLPNITRAARLTLFPRKIDAPITFTDKEYGKLVKFYFGKDFIFQNRDIIWKTLPPSWAERFSVRYWGIPEFIVREKPVVGIGRGECNWSHIGLEKRTIPEIDNETRVGKGNFTSNPYGNAAKMGYT